LSYIPRRTTSTSLRSNFVFWLAVSTRPNEELDFLPGSYSQVVLWSFRALPPAPSGCGPDVLLNELKPQLPVLCIDLSMPFSAQLAPTTVFTVHALRTMYCPSSIFLPCLLHMVLVTKDLALSQFCFSTLFRPRPHVMRHLCTAVYVIHFKCSGATTNNTALIRQPICASLSYPLAHIFSLYFWIFV